MIVYGKNPILEALRANRPIEKVTLQLENFVVLLLERAEEEGLEDIAKEIEGYYKRLIDAIKQRLLEI